MSKAKWLSVVAGMLVLYGGAYLATVRPVEEIAWLESGEVRTYIEPRYGFDDPAGVGHRVTMVFFRPANWLDRKLRPQVWATKTVRIRPTRS